MTAITLPLQALPRRIASLDRVWLVFFVVLGLLFALRPTQGVESLEFTVRALIGIAPFLAASIGVAAYAQATGADRLVARAFQGNVGRMIFLAAVFGGLSPFCSCGVIPLIAALLAMGVPIAPVMAFWLASPVMDPSMFVLTTGVLGLEFAVAKTIAAIGLGLMGGFATLALGGTRVLADPLRPEAGDGGCGGSRMRKVSAVVWKFWEEPERRADFLKHALKNTAFLGKWLAMAFLLESLMLAYLPAEMVATTLGGDGIMPILTATVVGVPAYLNGYAALPLAEALLGQGMIPGAAMAFLVAGGVTSIPAAVAVFALVRRPVFGLYIAYSLTGALIAGLIFQATAG